MKIKTIRPEYVTQFPSTFVEGVLYICEEFETAGHMCCCGCGEKVITPLNPAKWQIQKDGNRVSLFPSVGNWKYACQSHYWISRSQVIEAKKFDSKTIQAVQRRDRRAMEDYIVLTKATATSSKMQKPSLLDKLIRYLQKLFEG